jgi:ABC-2 type transport system ATP-binding protein
MAAAAPVIFVREVHKKYRSGDFWRPLRAEALTGVSLELRQGEVFGLIGLNGAGKTTLMKVMTGLLRPDRGEAGLFGLPPGSLEAKRRFGYLPELPYFPKYLSAWEVLHFYGRLHGLAKAALTRRVEAVLEATGILARARSPLREYSKGMMQRVGLAQTLLHDPELLFLDEPMSGLDPLGIKEMRDLILELKAKGKTIFYNSHILGEVEKLCDQVGFLVQGRLRGTEEVRRLRARKVSVESAFLSSLKAAEAGA